MPCRSATARASRAPRSFSTSLATHLPKDFKAKGNLFVFVDECHRTQGGVLNKAMKRIMGNDVMLIGFTGTPLLKRDKKTLTSQENFGSFIHTYKFDEAVHDGVILDLQYEARNVEQEPQGPDKPRRASSTSLPPTSRRRHAPSWPGTGQR